MAPDWSDWLLILSTAIPLYATFGKDALETFAGRFDVGMLLAPLLSQLAFNSGIGNGSIGPFTVGFDTLEIGNGPVEAGEFRCDLRGDTFLILKEWSWNHCLF